VLLCLVVCCILSRCFSVVFWALWRGVVLGWVELWCAVLCCVMLFCIFPKFYSSYRSWYRCNNNADSCSKQQTKTRNSSKISVCVSKGNSLTTIVLINVDHSLWKDWYRNSCWLVPFNNCFCVKNNEIWWRSFNQSNWWRSFNQLRGVPYQ
jgi:hypothetical protein